MIEIGAYTSVKAGRGDFASFIKEGGTTALFRWKIDVIAALDAAGYSMKRVKEEKLIGTRTYYDIKEGKVCGIIALNTLCRVLECQPGTLIKYVPDDSVSDTDSLPEV